MISQHEKSRLRKMNLPQKLNALIAIMGVPMRMIFLPGSAPSSTISQTLCQQNMKFWKFPSILQKMTLTELMKRNVSENISATETEFNAILNEQQNEKIPSFDKSTIHHTNNSDRNTKLQQINNFVNQGTIDLLSLQTYLKMVANKQNRELADLKKLFLTSVQSILSQK